MLIIIHDIVSDDFLSVEIVTMKHLFVNLSPKCDHGHVAGSAIFTRIGEQIVLREVVNIVFDSNIVDDGRFFTRNSDILILLPRLTAPLLK